MRVALCREGSLPKSVSYSISLLLSILSILSIQFLCFPLPCRAFLCLALLCTFLLFISPVDRGSCVLDSCYDTAQHSTASCTLDNPTRCLGLRINNWTSDFSALLCSTLLCCAFLCCALVCSGTVTVTITVSDSVKHTASSSSLPYCISKTFSQCFCQQSDRPLCASRRYFESDIT